VLPALASHLQFVPAMKSAVHETGMVLRNAVHCLAVIGMMIATASCGKPDSAASTLARAGQGDGQVAMKGYAGFGSQCLSGYNNDPKAVKLELWDCPINVATAELAEPLTPIMFSADCNRKVITVRTLDRAVDSTFYMMPDNTFYISQDKMNAKFKTDGSGNDNCTTPVIADIWGKVDCASGAGDKAKIRFETVMWLNKTNDGGTSTNAAPSGTPATTLPPTVAPLPMTGPRCKLPVGKCYFHVQSSVNQC
jgi:hypothetical protein